MSDDAFSVTVRPAPTGPVLTIRGDLDSRTSPEVLQKISGLSLSPGQLLVVDLRDVRFCDSSGISTFIAARNVAATAQGDLVLAGVPRQIRRVFAMIGLESLFDIRSDVDEAVSAHRTARSGDG